MDRKGQVVVLVRLEANPSYHEELFRIARTGCSFWRASLIACHWKKLLIAFIYGATVRPLSLALCFQASQYIEALESGV